ncbi:hypothetical protein MPSEU_000035100 [Mayamaea pseudoterrestris]|nr:hypothetical protein MPSEU_000035100 [Mayamaea pseudoterrestris]
MIASAAASHEDENDNEVRRVDQDQINRFARLNVRKHEIEEDVVKYKKELEHLDDASTELMMGSGDKVLLMLGEAFFEESEDYATQVCEQLVEQAQAKLDALETELQAIAKEQGVLKNILYDRFGKSINLEEK